MRFTETPLHGAFVIELDLLTDDRGHFARTFDAGEFAAHGLDPAVVQCNTSFNARRGTLRGMHYQADPDGEAKLVRCTRGAIYDVAVYLRPESGTYGTWFGAELSVKHDLQQQITELLAQALSIGVFDRLDDLVRFLD